MIKVEDFRFRHRFTSDITDLMLEQAIQVVNAQFSGVYHLWSSLPPDVRDAKRELCISYLIAWNLATTYPDHAISVSGTGAMPIKSKKAGPVSITYRDTVRQGGGTILDSLTVNEFGMQALLMIQTAPENYMLVR